MGLSDTLHVGIRFLPPPTPAIRSPPFAGRTPGLSFREDVGVIMFIKSVTARSWVATFDPGRTCSSDHRLKYIHGPLPYLLVHAFSLSGQFHFRMLSITGLAVIHAMFDLLRSPLRFPLLEPNGLRFVSGASYLRIAPNACPDRVERGRNLWLLRYCFHKPP